VRGALASLPRSVWRHQHMADGERIVPEETAIAFTYDGGAYAVMMATPQDLEDFAVGFSLTEGIVGSPAEIGSLEMIALDTGIELRMWLSERRAAALSARRRYLAGPTGCGLCGIESIAQACRVPARVTPGHSFTPDDIMRAVAELAPLQELNRQTRAVHAAGFWVRGQGLLAVREDVGRHNALDKLGGALVRSGCSAAAGMILLTSRVSVEMVQKAAALGCPVMVAVSAPTALAVRTAQAAEITLVAVARGDGFEVFSHPQRMAGEVAADVA
jgi:FdhD protein